MGGWVLPTHVATARVVTLSSTAGSPPGEIE